MPAPFRRRRQAGRTAAAPPSRTPYRPPKAPATCAQLVYANQHLIPDPEGFIILGCVWSLIDTPGRVVHRSRVRQASPRRSGNRQSTKRQGVFGVRRGVRAKIRRKDSNGSQTVQADEPRPTFPDGLDFAEITTDKPEKSLLAPLSNKAGRNNNGPYRRGTRAAATRRRYRIIDFKRQKDGVPAKVATIEYDPNRSARIALFALRRRRGATSCTEEGPPRGRHRHRERRPRGRHQAGQRCRFSQHPRRHAHPRRGVAAGQGRRHRAFPPAPASSSGGKEEQLRHPAHAVLEMRRVLIDTAPRWARSVTPSMPTSRSARPDATAGRASAPASAVPS